MHLEADNTIRWWRRLELNVYISINPEGKVVKMLFCFPAQRRKLVLASFNTTAQLGRESESEVHDIISLAQQHGLELLSEAKPLRS